MEFNPFLTLELVEPSRIRRIGNLRKNMFSRYAYICARELCPIWPSIVERVNRSRFVNEPYRVTLHLTLVRRVDRPSFFLGGFNV